MKQQDCAGHRPRMGRTTALAVVLGLAMLGSANAADRSERKGSRTEAAQPAAKQAGASGNWMREYVQLRVDEQNLRVSDGEIAPRSERVQPRIVGGTLAGAADNPFQVGLMNKAVADDFQSQFCGGTLIRPNVVVTAAHCSDFVTAGEVQVLTGSRNLDGTGTRHDVTRIAIPARWNEDTFDFDVAVWILSTPANGIQLASVPAADPSAGTDLLITGWGTLTEGGSYPTSLYKATVPMVSRSNCNDANSYGGDITLRMVCAGFDAGGVDTCQGDSGGPLTRGNQLIGITSFGDGCARPNKPGVYTRVSTYLVRNFILTAAGL